MRCFIAIDLPAEIRNELAEIQNKLPKDSKLIFVNPENIHLTIKFLGEIDDAKTSKVKEILKKFQFKQFKAKLSGIGVFPSTSFIRVIWVGIEPKENFVKIHSLIDKLTSLENIKIDLNWENHATLARVKFIKDKKAFQEQLKKIKINPIEFTVDNLKLKKSTLTPDGPVYEDILEIKMV
jgi:2'-5' RNA ligase